MSWLKCSISNMYLPVALFFIFLSLSLLLFIVKKFKFSEFVGLIILSLLIATPFLKSNLILGNEEFFLSMTNVGLFSLLFVSGFKIADFLSLYKSERNFFKLILLFIAELFIGVVLLKIVGFDFLTSIVVALCFSLIIDFNLIKKNKNSVLGSLRFFLGIFSIVFISYFFSGHLLFNSLWLLGGVLLSITLGVLVHLFFDRKSEEIIFLEKVLYNTFIPLFFVSVGISLGLLKTQFQLSSFLIIFIFSCLVKVVSIFITKKLNRDKEKFLISLSFKREWYFELIIVFIALKVGLIGIDIYLAFVVMVIIFVAGNIFLSFVNKLRKIK